MNDVPKHWDDKSTEEKRASIRADLAASEDEYAALVADAHDELDDDRAEAKRRLDSLDAGGDGR